MTSSAATAKTVYYEDGTYDAALDMVSEHEFNLWRNALPRHNLDVPASERPRLVAVQAWDTPVCPHPTTGGGLPEGWQVRWRTGGTTPDSTVGTNTYEVFLVQRETGGWGVVFHSNAHEQGPVRTSRWPHTSLNVPGLYAKAVKFADGGYAHVVEHHIRDYVLSHYDLRDPVEAAEATLVGLGARITTFPRALTN